MSLNIKHKIYIVETESGLSCNDPETLVFDSAWSSYEKAKSYCEKFKRDPKVWHSENIDYEITEYIVDSEV